MVTFKILLLGCLFWCQEDGASARTGRNGHTLEQMRNLTLTMAEHWFRLPREVMESLSLETFTP